MSDHVWVSSAINDPSLILPVVTDVSSKQTERAVKGQELNEAGKPVPPELCPNRIWGESADAELRKLPDLFWAMSQFVVSERAANIIGNCYLGGGALHPVTEGVYQSDNTTRIDGNYFVWIFGNNKDAFLPDDTPKKRPWGVSGQNWKFPFVLKDDDVAVSREALAGPDVWLDVHLIPSIFVSEGLGDAMVAAHLRNAFRLFKCRVL